MKYLPRGWSKTKDWDAIQSGRKKPRSKRYKSWWGKPFKEGGKWYAVFHKGDKYGYTNYLYESKGPF